VVGRVDAEARWFSQALTQDRLSPVLPKEQIGRGCKNEILPNRPVSVLFLTVYKCLASCFLRGEAQTVMMIALIDNARCCLALLTHKNLF